MPGSRPPETLLGAGGVGADPPLRPLGQLRALGKCSGGAVGPGRRGWPGSGSPCLRPSCLSCVSPGIFKFLEGTDLLEPPPVCRTQISTPLKPRAPVGTELQGRKESWIHERVVLTFTKMQQGQALRLIILMVGSLELAQLFWVFPLITKGTTQRARTGNIYIRRSPGPIGFW